MQMGIKMEFIIQGFWEFIQFILNNIVFINVLLSIVIVFFQRKEPTSVWAWLLILYSIPIIGFLFYLLVGMDFHKKKMFRTKEIEDRLNEAIRKQETSIINKELGAKDPQITPFSDLIMYNLESNGSVLTDDNDIIVYIDGNRKFDALIEDIRQAQNYIFIQYYIIRNDVLFNRIKDELLEKIKSGVEVKILYDGMGCRNVRKEYWKKLNQQGIETAEFFPATLRRLHLRMNYRNHRKIVVIDGKIGYVGGFNIGKEYIGLVKKFGYWRDTHLRLQGSAVHDLFMHFVLDWNYSANENLFTQEKYNPPTIETSPGKCEIQIISSGPDSMDQNIRNNYLRLISKAEKSIFIQTPYFVPDEAILSALIIACHSGIDVNVMIPCKPDHPFVYWATYSHVGDLVMAGAKCYTYNNGFLHSKGLMIDGKVFCYGTANMDIRSFKLNFEVNAIVFDEEETRKMQRIFYEDLKYCKQITKEIYTQRSLMVRIKEQFCRLLSPIL